MATPDRLVSGLAIGAILLMGAALAADVAVNSTNINLTGYADIVGPPPSASDSVLEVQMTGSWATGHAGGFFAPTTGFAVWGESGGGAAMHGTSTSSYGVWGASTDSWGGYFTSTQGYGLRVDTSGTDHYDHGAYITSDGGYGVYALSDNNQALRGEAGDVSGVTAAFGRVGVVGMGENRGVHGASENGLGVYGTSVSSTGVYGNTGRTDRNYGLYTNDNLFSFNVNLLGAIMQVAQNTGDDSLEPGDIVALAGIGVAGHDPQGDARTFRRLGHDPESVVQVVRAGGRSSGVIAGVVQGRYSLEALVALGLGSATEGSETKAEHDEGSPWVQSGDPPPSITPPGPVESGDYLLVVVHGPAVARVDASGAAIRPGDALALGPTPGVAAATQALKGLDEGNSTLAVIGAALEPIVTGQQLARVFVAPR